MTFSTAASTPRPIRLQEATREWAYTSMQGKYGDEAMRHLDLSLDHIEGFEVLSELDQYNRAIREIAERAPIRICEAERICGAATLGRAIWHDVPVTYQGERVFRSVSHLTIRYDKVLKEGLSSYTSEITERLQDDTLTETQVAYLHSLINVIECIRIWHSRYLEATKESRPDLHRLLQQVPFSPARTFHEAVQALWFIFSFVRLCGNWPGIGRLDWLLKDYLQNDMDENEMREILASFFIKGCEWIQSETPVGSGDAQHYQNIVLAGVDENGNEVTNQVTFLALDIVEELAISDYPITVRLNRQSPPALKQKVAEVMRHGGGIVAVYNEDLILQALKKLGYPTEEARAFANDGCWEVQIPGKTDFAYMPFDALQIFNQILKESSYSNIEELYRAFCDALNEKVQKLYRERIENKFICKDGCWQAKTSVLKTSVIDLFEDDCIQNARSYYDFGPRYVVRSPHIGGAPDVANSLHAIQKLVFDEKRISLPELIQLLNDNWEGNEPLRLYVKNSYTYYGNDSDEADQWHSRLLNDFAKFVDRCNDLSNCPALFIPGISTFGRQIEWCANRSATAFGYRKGDILSGNDSPVPGTDTNGATAIIKSYCKADLVQQSCGAALDIKIFPHSLSGENGITALIALMDGFLTLGGFFMQLDTLDVQTLREAQKDPQRFKSLSVRVSGWNARFVTLNKEWQDMIIERSAQEF